MPKKKEKKTGEKPEEKKRSSQKKSEPRGGDQVGSEDTERELLLIQMGFLSEQLEGFQLRCDELGKQNKVLLGQRRALEQEKKDMAAYLKGCVLEKEAEVDVLMERLQDQRQTADQHRDDLQLQHRLLTQDLHDRIHTLVSENQSLAENLAHLEEFQTQKEKLMSEMASMEKQLANQREEHRDDVHSVEMKALMEKRSLERELEHHLVAMAAEVQQQVEQKLPESTRQALEENGEVKARLGLLSEHVRVLTEENAALRGRSNRLGVDVDVLEQTLSQTSRTSCIRRKVAEQLTGKCQRLQAEQETWKQQVEQLQGQNQELQAETEELRREQASLAEQRRADRAEVSRLEAELQEERKRRSKMKSIMQDAALTLQHALTEAPPDQDPVLDPVPVLRWKRLIQELLEVLLRRFVSATESGRSGVDEAPAASRSRTDHQLPGHPTSKHKKMAPQTGSGSSSSGAAPNTKH